jgi:hypothetical protein
MRNHEIDSAPIRNDMVFLILSETGKRRKTSKLPCFTKCGQEPTIAANMRGLKPTLAANEPTFRFLATWSCTSILRIIPTPEKQVAYLHFTDLGGGMRDGA